MPFNKKISELKKLAEKPLFKNAIQNVNLQLLSFQEKIFIICLKYHLYRLCFLLVKIKNDMFTKKLSEG